MASVVCPAKDRLVSGLCRQRESGEYCDVLITVSDISMTVHSNVLAVSSVYFSDIARRPSSLLPHIPSTRVRGHVSLSVTIERDIGKETPSEKQSMHLHSLNPVGQESNRQPDTHPEDTQISTVPEEVYYVQPSDEGVNLDQVIFTVQETPNGVTLLRSDFCDGGMSAAIMNSGGAGDGISVVQSTADFPQTMHAMPLKDIGILSEDLVTADSSSLPASEEGIVSGVTPPPANMSPANLPSMTARHHRGTHGRSSFKYVLDLALASGAAAETSCLADCVRELVDFAYCGPLAITEETYPMMHDLAKLLQMEEAISLCEKHAVDRLVGSSPEPPPPPTPEPPSGPNRPASGEAPRLRVCRNCSFVCHGAARMLEHRRMHHVRSYMCGFCGVTRQKTSQLLRHLIQAEHGETVCSLCFYECGPGESMAEHYLRHNDPRPFFCSVCFARFPSRTGLNLHMPTHSSAKPFECHTCGRAFKWRHALQSHARTHGTEKKLLCDVCGFCTRHTGQFKAHKARHAGATEPCPHEGCSFRATTSWLLKDHLVTHAADKQYQCEVCGKKFGHVRNMRRHALLHGRQVALSCQRCPYQTTRSDKLAQHVRVKHGPPSPAAAGGDEKPRPAESATTETLTAAPKRQRLAQTAPTAKRRRKERPPPPPPADGGQHRLLAGPSGPRLVPILPKDPELVPAPAVGEPRRVRIRRRVPTAATREGREAASPPREASADEAQLSRCQSTDPSCCPAGVEPRGS